MEKASKNSPVKLAWVVASAFGLLMGATQCAHVPMDPSVAAATANDETIQFQGGGATSQRGYLFFQKSAGTLPTDAITLILPAVSCSHTNCVEFQFFRKDGSASYGAGVPAGQTQIQFKLSDVLGSALAVDQTEDGEYSAIVKIYYLDSTGAEQNLLLNGFIRLNVLQAGYSPVGCNDPAIAWKVATSKTCETQFTTAGRSVACGAGC